MRCLCLLLTCICLCGCFSQSPQKAPENPPAVVQLQVTTKPTGQTTQIVDFRDKQLPNNLGWPVTIVICSLFLFIAFTSSQEM